MMCVDCVAGLSAGLPIVSRAFDYRMKVWKIRSSVIRILAEFLQLAAALSPSGYFYPLVALARIMAAAAATSGSRVNGAIPNAMMRASSAESKEIELIHINVAAQNQRKLISVPTGVLSVAFLYSLVSSGWHPSLESQLLAFVTIQVLNLCAEFGMYQNMPALHEEQAQETVKNPSHSFGSGDPLLDTQGTIGYRSYPRDRNSTALQRVFFFLAFWLLVVSYW